MSSVFTSSPLIGPAPYFGKRIATSGHTREQAGQFVWMVLYGVVALLVGRPDVEWAPGLLEFSLETALEGLVR